MITNNQIEEYLLAKAECARKRAAIVVRVDEILHVVYGFFGNPIYTWSFPNGSEIDLGDLNDAIEFEVMDYPRLSMKTWCWDYEHEFPASFLEMTDVEILDYLTNEVKITAEKIHNELEIKNLKKDQIVDRALKKLTDEEKEVLGLQGIEELRQSMKIVSTPGAVIQRKTLPIPDRIQKRISQALRDGGSKFFRRLI